jgi:chromosome segregation ATPase
MANRQGTMSQHALRNDPAKMVKEEASTVAFESLEQEFHTFIATLERDPSLAHVRIEHEKLFRALQKTYTNEKRMIKKSRGLNSELVNNAAHIQKAVQLAKENESTVHNLQRDLEKAWTMTEESHQKEAKSLETTLKLQEELKLATGTSNEARKQHEAHMHQIMQLQSEKEKLQIESNEQMAELQVLQKELTENRAMVRRLEAQKSDLESRWESSSSDLTDSQEKAIQETHKRELLEKEMQQLRWDLEQRSKSYDDTSRELQVLAAAKADVEKDLQFVAEDFAESRSKVESLSAKLEKTTVDLENERKTKSNLKFDLEEAQTNVGTLTSERKRLESEKRRTEKQLEEKAQFALKHKRAADQTKITLAGAQRETKVLCKEIEAARENEDRLHKDLRMLQRERKLHLTQLETTQKKFKEAGHEAAQREDFSLTLEKEIEKLRGELRLQQSAARELEREIGSRDLEIGTARADHKETLQDLAAKHQEIDLLKETTQEREQKIRLQQKQYDSKVKDLEAEVRSVKEHESRIKFLKEDATALKQNIKRLEEDLSQKNALIVTKHYDSERTDALSDKYDHHSRELKRLINVSDDTIQQQKIEINKLANVIKSMGDDFRAHVKECKQVLHERDILGTQLMRRNDELALLGEKIRMQQEALKTGEEQYAERLDDIRIMKLKVKDLDRELVIAKKGSVSFFVIEHALIQKHQELLREQVKVKALADELESPSNLHRWRKLEGSDPAMFEMIQKAQHLQRRLIRKEEQVRIAP